MLRTFQRSIVFLILNITFLLDIKGLPCSNSNYFMAFFLPILLHVLYWMLVYPQRKAPDIYFFCLEYFYSTIYFMRSHKSWYSRLNFTIHHLKQVSYLYTNHKWYLLFLDIIMFPCLRLCISLWLKYLHLLTYK